MATTPFQPPIGIDGSSDWVLTEAERNFIDETPANLFPENPDSNWGFKRKIFCDKLQVSIDQLATIYKERFIDTSEQFLDEWEEQYLIPKAPTDLDLVARRNIVKNRMKKGAFTRQRIQNLVEASILSEFETPTQLNPDGLALDANGLTLFDEPAIPLQNYYRIYYDSSTFTYTVYVVNLVTINAANLFRELRHFSPGGTDFTINNSLDNIRDYQRTVLADGPTAYWPLQTTSGTGFPWNSIAGLTLTLVTGVPGSIPATSVALVQRGGMYTPDNGARDFDGVDDMLTIPINSSLAFGTGPRTFEAWISLDALPTSGVYFPVFAWPPASGGVYSIFGVANLGSGARFVYKAAATAGAADIAEGVVTSITPSTGTTYHIVGTWDGGGLLRYYVNGAKVLEQNFGQKDWIPLLGSGNKIGNGQGVADWFNGKIDEPAIYGNILSDAQVLRHYQTGIDTG